MTKAPFLLNDDQTASIATFMMMSHHGFRRDIARFQTALERVERGDAARVEALREEWGRFVASLHGHHQAEDAGIFPNIAGQSAEAAAVIDQLSLDHRRIDPLLERGAAAFAELPNAGPALAVVAELAALLGPHLATEEREVIPFLRGAKDFPVPPDEATLELYAQGFAWAMHGIAEDVLEQARLLLPAGLLARLPAARAAFNARCLQVWGSDQTGAARTPIPEDGA